MRSSGHYSNPPEALETVLRSALEGSPSRRRASTAVLPEAKRLGNSVVQRAVIRALAEAGRVMDVGEAHGAVEALLARSVSRDSVNSCLSTGARGADRLPARRTGPLPAQAPALKKAWRQRRRYRSSARAGVGHRPARRSQLVHLRSQGGVCRRARIRTEAIVSGVRARDSLGDTDFVRPGVGAVAVWLASSAVVVGCGSSHDVAARPSSGRLRRPFIDGPVDRRVSGVATARAPAISECRRGRRRAGAAVCARRCISPRRWWPALSSGWLRCGRAPRLHAGSRGRL